MSRLKDPVGPHSKRVYQRRRIVLLAVLIGIPVIALLIIFKPGSTGGVAKTEEVSLSADFSETSNPKKSTAADDLPGCKKSNIDVTAVANKESYGPGENPEIWMTVSNTGSKPCVIDLGTKELSFEIVSGSEAQPEVYWVSTHCQTGSDSREVILEPDNPLSTTPLVWDRTRSAPETCDVAREPVPAGGAAYRLYATANSVKSSEGWQFLLN
jgi:hypothetical protein